MTDAALDPFRRPADLAEQRRVTQPDAVRSRRNAEHWTASLYLRDLSPFLTWLLLRTRISANGVTGIMILTGWTVAGALLLPGIVGALLGLVLGQLQMLVDCSDGEVARWRGVSSPVGPFLDAVGHYSTEALIALALGIRAIGSAAGGEGAYRWMFYGALLALVIVLNKALNDMVRVARANAGAPKLNYSEAESAPRPGLLSAARRLARFVPFHRLFHSVELTMVTLAMALLGLVIGEELAARATVIGLLALGLVTLVGHFVAIMTSRRLRD